MSTDRADLATRLEAHERLLDFLVEQEPRFPAGDWAAAGFWSAVCRVQDRVLSLTEALFDADRRAAYGDVAAALRLIVEGKQ